MTTQSNILTMNDILKIRERSFSSRLFVGTGKFPSSEKMLEAIIASGSEMITVAMKRINMMNEATDDMLTHINRERVQLLPNTSGVRDAGEAVLSALLEIKTLFIFTAVSTFLNKSVISL